MRTAKSFYETPRPLCPKCNGDTIKHGFVRVKRALKQRYICTGCGTSFYSSRDYEDI